MRKILLGVVIVCLLCCSGCVEYENIESRAERGTIDYVDITYNIVADKDTHILYYYYGGGSESFMCPYYSKNGRLCRYEDGKIIEVWE